MIDSQTHSLQFCLTEYGVWGCLHSTDTLDDSEIGNLNRPITGLVINETVIKNLPRKKMPGLADFLVNSTNYLKENEHQSFSNSPKKK